jgi:hypothetical protein
LDVGTAVAPRDRAGLLRGTDGEGDIEGRAAEVQHDDGDLSSRLARQDRLRDGECKQRRAAVPKTSHGISPFLWRPAILAKPAAECPHVQRPLCAYPKAHECMCMTRGR